MTMNGKKLKYEFSQEEANYILQMLNKVQIVGVQSAQVLLAIVQKVQSPTNATDLEKDQLEALKTKYEPKKDDIKKANQIHGEYRR